MYKLVIFDADGTLVETNSGYEFRKGAHDWRVMPRRLETLQGLHEQGVKTAMASNQGGVAFGYFTLEEISWELQLAAYELGIEQIALCPFHPKATLEEYRQDSIFRKPRPGMLLTAMETADVTASETLMVGDRPEDEQAAKLAGCAFEHADTFFAPPQDVEHRWRYYEDRGKSGYACERCGLVRGLSEIISIPCDGRMDVLRAHLQAGIDDLQAKLGSGSV